MSFELGTEFKKAANSMMWARTARCAGLGIFVAVLALGTATVIGGNYEQDMAGIWATLHQIANATLWGGAAGGAFGLARGAREKADVIKKALHACIPQQSSAGAAPPAP